LSQDWFAARNDMRLNLISGLIADDFPLTNCWQCQPTLAKQNRVFWFHACIAFLRNRMQIIGRIVSLEIFLLAEQDFHSLRIFREERQKLFLADWMRSSFVGTFAEYCYLRFSSIRKNFIASTGNDTDIKEYSPLKTKFSNNARKSAVSFNTNLGIILAPWVGKYVTNTNLILNTIHQKIWCLVPRSKRIVMKRYNIKKWKFQPLKQRKSTKLLRKLQS